MVKIKILAILICTTVILTACTKNVAFEFLMWYSKVVTPLYKIWYNYKNKGDVTMGKYQRYNEDFKKEMIRLHLEDGRTKKSLSDEYNIGAGTTVHRRAVTHSVTTSH